MFNRIKWGMLFLAIGFVLLFSIRLAADYSGYSSQIDNGIEELTYLPRKTEGKGVKNNYASTKMRVEGGLHNSQSIEQKYERIADLESRSPEFDSDETMLRDTIKELDALIQFEESSGLKGTRALYLAVGVHPDKFDDFVSRTRSIGRITSINIHKTDKTNEYKELKAQRISLEKTSDSLSALKERGGRIDELSGLESRILELEKEIQSLGIKLGEYDEENEFCTVNFALVEQAGAADTPFVLRAMGAFKWTVSYCAALIGIGLIGGLMILLTIIILEKIKQMPATLEKPAEKPAE